MCFGGVGIGLGLNVGGDVVLWVISSDERYKENIKPIENPNEKLKQMVDTLLIGTINMRCLKDNMMLV